MVFEIRSNLHEIAQELQGRLGDQWFLDEVFININGRPYYLWRAVDQDNNTLEILVQKNVTRDQR